MHQAGSAAARPDPAVVSASVPFALLPSDDEMAAALRAPERHPVLQPHLERLLLELPPGTVLGFAARQGIGAAVLRAAYARVSAAARLRNRAFEEAVDGLA
jgi:hypothetical protein